MISVRDSAYLGLSSYVTDDWVDLNTVLSDEKNCHIFAKLFYELSYLFLKYEFQEKYKHLTYEDIKKDAKKVAVLKNVVDSLAASNILSVSEPAIL